jgi:hypothetical protein
MRSFVSFLQDVVLMGTTLEKIFYEKLVDMPADV